MRYHNGLDATIGARAPARRGRRLVSAVRETPTPPPPPRPVVGLVTSGGSPRATAFPSPFARAGQIVRYTLDPAHCLACDDQVAMLAPQPLAFGDGRTAEKGACARCERPVIRFMTEEV